MSKYIRDGSERGRPREIYFRLESAARYSLNPKQPLMAFLCNGKVPIPNNLAENAIRPFTIGRANWHIIDTVHGAEASATIYILVETAKANKELIILFEM